MDLKHEAAMFRLKPYLVDVAGVSVFQYPGLREEFADNLVNLGAASCIIHFALKFEGALIDLDLLFYIVDIVRTKDNSVIFYSPDSRVLDMKIIQRT
jgi:hypothetical protein